MEDDRIDSMLLALAQRHTGGIDDLLDTFFSFLRRKTDFFAAASTERAQKAVVDAVKRQQAIHMRTMAQTAAAKFDAETKRQAKQAKEARERAEAEEVVRARLEAKAAADAAAAKGGEDKVLEPSADGTFDVSAAAAAPAAAAPAAAAAAASGTAEEAEEAKADGGLAPTEGNGYDRGVYSFTQTLQDVTVSVPVPSGTRGRDLDIEVTAKALRVGVKGTATVLEGPTFAALLADDCTWTIEDADSRSGGGRLVTLTLAKAQGMSWWPHVVTTEPKLDLGKVEPENSKLSDLDADTRKTVEKMMFDSRQKAMGKPTSDELERQRVLERFMAQHPEMDFSKAKLS